MDGLNVARHVKACFERYRLIGLEGLLGRHRTPRRAWSANIDPFRLQGGSHRSIAMIRVGGGVRCRMGQMIVQI